MCIYNRAKCTGGAAHRYVRVNMQAARLLAALGLWCAAQAVLGDDYTQEKDYFDDNINLKPDAAVEKQLLAHTEFPETTNVNTANHERKTTMTASDYDKNKVMFTHNIVPKPEAYKKYTYSEASPINNNFSVSYMKKKSNQEQLIDYSNEESTTINNENGSMIAATDYEKEKFVFKNNITSKPNTGYKEYRYVRELSIEENNPVSYLKIKTYKDQAINYSIKDITTINKESNPTITPTDYEKRKDGNDLSNSKNRSQANSVTPVGHDVETSKTTVSPVTLSEKSVKDKNEETTSNSPLGEEILTSSVRSEDTYNLASQNNNDFSTNMFKEDGASLKAKQKQIKKVLRSYRRMEENLKNYNNNINEDYIKKEKTKEDAIDQYINLNTKDMSVPKRPSEDTLDKQRLKLLDYIARAAHTTHPSPAPTIILYGYPAKKSSVMSVFMAVPPECPEPILEDVDINGLRKDKLSPVMKGFRASRLMQMPKLKI